MRTLHGIFFVIVLCFPAAAAKAQPVTFTSGELLRGPTDAFQQVSGTFHFVAPNADINGELVGSGGSGVYTYCATGLPPRQCFAGGIVEILDHITGQTALRQNITPVVVNGTTYPTMIYSGSTLKFEAGNRRISWNIAKRRTFQLTFPAKVTGSLIGRLVPGGTPVFTSAVDLKGTVTVSFAQNDPQFFYPMLTFKIAGVTYNFPAP